MPLLLSSQAANEGNSPYAMVALARMILLEEGGQTNLQALSSPGFNRILAKNLLSKAITQHDDMNAQFELGKVRAEKARVLDVDIRRQYFRI